jgi:trimeric autotransporter adhesin
LDQDTAVLSIGSKEETSGSTASIRRGSAGHREPATASASAATSTAVGSVEACTTTTATCGATTTTATSGYVIDSRATALTALKRAARAPVFLTAGATRTARSARSATVRSVRPARSTASPRAAPSPTDTALTVPATPLPGPATATGDDDGGRALLNPGRAASSAAGPFGPRAARAAVPATVDTPGATGESSRLTAAPNEHPEHLEGCHVEDPARESASTPRDVSRAPAPATSAPDLDVDTRHALGDLELELAR